MFWLFWITVAFLGYTFLGYPLLLWLLSRRGGKSHGRAPIAPRITLIIAAHNAQNVIATKIENCLQLTYPPDRREIIIATDGCDDATVAIARSYSDRGICVVEQSQRRGKHYVQMMARDASTGEILVFTDVGVSLEPDALQTIAANFADAAVGAVSSEDWVVTPRARLGEAAYVSLEMWLRRLESRVGSLVGLSGSFFAARRPVCQRWNPEQSSDFFIALNAVRQGMRAVVDTNSHGHFAVLPRETAEFGRKVRTIVHGLDVFFANLALLNPLRYGVFSWQLISHKLFRWLLPFALGALLVANVFLWQQGVFYRITLMVQGALYLAGLLGLARAGLVQFKPLKLAVFFLVGNAATVLAWVKFWSGEKFVTWEPSRRG